MNKASPSGARRQYGLLFIAVASLVMAGCSDPQKDAPDPVVLAPAPPPPPAEPSLRAASDAHLTLFGEFPTQSRVPFQARASSAMKQHSFTSEGADYDVDVSPEGRWIVFSSTRHSAQPDVYLKQIEGRAVTKLTDDPSSDVQPVFSPDGKRIAFASFRAGNWDLWTIGLEGGQARQITRSPQHQVHPTWSPDGKRLAYCMFNDVSQQWELWTLQLDQPGSQRMIGIGLFPEWSPTGDSIVYQKARERGGRWFSIWRVDLEMGEPGYPIELGSSSEMAMIQPNWSPDGQMITYGTARMGLGGEPLSEGESALTKGDIWTMQADGSSPMQLTDGGGTHFSSVWSVDGRVYFTSRITGSENIWSIRPFSGENIAPAAGNQDSTDEASTLGAIVSEPEGGQGG